MAVGRSPSIRCGSLVREARIRNGFSQGELGYRLGMAQSAISRIERDSNSPSIDTVGRILEAMGETLLLRSVPLDAPLPGGGNQSVAELRRDGRLTSEERLSEAAELSEVATSLASEV